MDGEDGILTLAGQILILQDVLRYKNGRKSKSGQIRKWTNGMNGMNVHIGNVG